MSRLTIGSIGFIFMVSLGFSLASPAVAQESGSSLDDLEKEGQSDDLDVELESRSTQQEKASDKQSRKKLKKQLKDAGLSDKQIKMIMNKKKLRNKAKKINKKNKEKLKESIEKIQEMNDEHMGNGSTQSLD